LIERIAQKNKVACIGDLLVGFKYIAAEMNTLEKTNTINDFILGTEESHGFLMGNYCRDKDAACAAVWIAELAAEWMDSTKSMQITATATTT
jgi:phosphoglucomutase/phosphomannomutase